MQGILNQNERVLEIEKQLLNKEDIGSEKSGSTQMINLFLNNQRLLEQLLHIVKKEDASIKQYGQDVAVIKK